MTHLGQYRDVFIQKLKDTGDMDAAFGKAIWVAYTQGLVDGLTDARPDKSEVIDAALEILDSALRSRSGDGSGEADGSGSGT